MELSNKRFKLLVGVSKQTAYSLTDFEKVENQQIAREYIFIENINVRLKVFKILPCRFSKTVEAMLTINKDNGN